LKQNDGVDAVMMDWDLPATRGIETLLLLMGAPFVSGVEFFG
jgi:hypothetical protein